MLSIVDAFITENLEVSKSMNERISLSIYNLTFSSLLSKSFKAILL